MLQPVIQTTVSKKWQIVLPKKARRVLTRIEPGQKVWVRPMDKKTLVVSFSDPIVEGRGLLKGPSSLTKVLLEEREKEKVREEKKAKHLNRT